MILEDYDTCEKSTFEPSDVESKIINFPTIGITCFSKTLIQNYIEKFGGEVIAWISNANGKEPVYKIMYKEKEFALFMSRVGASACTTAYEEVLAMGLEKLIMFGSCGVLDRNIEDLAIIIPTGAIRDEGTSYHYIPSCEEITVNEKYQIEFKQILKEHHYSFVEGKVWTTDAPYRETRNKVVKRKAQGCICVDMECSAMSAVSKFRNKPFFQFFYSADNLDHTKWDKRSLANDDKLSEKEKIIFLALELALKL